MCLLYAGNARRAGWIATAVLFWGACYGQPGIEFIPDTIGNDQQLCNPIPPARYDVREHARQYLRSTFGLQVLGVGLASAITSTAFPGMSGLGLDRHDFPNR